MKTTIDWLTFRCRDNPYQVLAALSPAWGMSSDLVTFKGGLKGKDGWLYAGQLLLAGDIVLGRIDYGGDSQRGWTRVSLSGTGCQWVGDWSAVVRMGAFLTEATIKRLDIALTTFNGEVSDLRVANAHASGGFTAGGRPPVMQSIGSSDPRAGRTRYIGSRKSHKFLRCYEKGFELLKDVPASIRDQVLTIEGHQVENIYRVELELKDVDKLIPWEVIDGRDDVFSSAYPFCAELLPSMNVWRMPSLPDFKEKATLDCALNNCRTAYGGTLRAALMAFNGDRDRLLDAVLAEQPSSALVEAGILTVDH